MVNILDKKAMKDWELKCKEGEVCILTNCATKPVVECKHCGMWACPIHSYAFQNKPHIGS